MIAKFGRVNGWRRASKEVCFTKEFQDVSELVKFLVGSHKIFLMDHDMTPDEYTLFKKKYLAIRRYGNGILYNSRNWSRIVKNTKNKIRAYNNSSNSSIWKIPPVGSFELNHIRRIESQYGRKFKEKYSDEES